MAEYICAPSEFLIGELAQLARALAWHARGHRFDSGILHELANPFIAFKIRIAIFQFFIY